MNDKDAMIFIILWVLTIDMWVFAWAIIKDGKEKMKKIKKTLYRQNRKIKQLQESVDQELFGENIPSWEG